MSGSLASSLEQRLQCLVRTVKTVQYINISGKWAVCFAVRQHKQWHQNKNKTYVCTSTTKPLTKSGTVKSKEMQISSKRGICKVIFEYPVDMESHRVGFPHLW